MLSDLRGEVPHTLARFRPHRAHVSKSQVRLGERCTLRVDLVEDVYDFIDREVIAGKHIHLVGVVSDRVQPVETSKIALDESLLVVTHLLQAFQQGIQSLQ